MDVVQGDQNFVNLFLGSTEKGQFFNKFLSFWIFVNKLPCYPRLRHEDGKLPAHFHQNLLQIKELLFKLLDAIGKGRGLVLDTHFSV